MTAAAWSGVGFDLTLSIWVLQHCPAPARDIARIRKALRRPGGGPFVANGNARSVPTAERGWFNDGFDVMGAPNGAFEPLPPARARKTSETIANGTFWATFRT